MTLIYYISRVVILACFITTMYCDDSKKKEAVDCIKTALLKMKPRLVFRECCARSLTTGRTSQQFQEMYMKCIQSKLVASGGTCIPLLLEAEFNLDFQVDMSCLNMLRENKPNSCEPWVIQLQDCANSICTLLDEYIQENPGKFGRYEVELVQDVCNSVKST